MPKCVKSLVPSPILVCVRMMDGWDGSLFTSSVQAKNDDWFYSVMWSLDCTYTVCTYVQLRAALQYTCIYMYTYGRYTVIQHVIYSTYAYILCILVCITYANE